MKKGYKTGLVVIALLMILLGGVLIYKYMIDRPEGPKNEVKVVSKIEEYNYTLDGRDTNLFKNEFEKLNDILKKETVDETEYAKSLGKLFIIDLYTVSTKINRYDVGSLEYIHSSKVNEFKLKVMDTLYKNVIDNTDGGRSQDLPAVNEINVLTCNSSTYKLGDESVDSYVVTLKWEYIKDLGYDNEGTITFVKEGNKLVVVDFQPSITTSDTTSES